MEFMLMFLGIAIVFTIIEYQIQTLKEEMKRINQRENKPKQFRREHTAISKTNFRKYIEWTNRCIFKI